MRERAYSLAEVLLALGLAVVVVLTLVGVGLTALTSNQKAGDVAMAESSAHDLLESMLYGAQQDPSVALWGANDDLNPYSVTPLAVGSQTYTAALYVADVVGVDTPSMKRCRMRMSWWGGEEARSGYGRLYCDVVRFVSRP